jgi:hypothetical protein
MNSAKVNAVSLIPSVRMISFRRSSISGGWTLRWTIRYMTAPSFQISTGALVDLWMTHNSWQNQIQSPKNIISNEIFESLVTVLPAVYPAHRHNKLLKRCRRDQQTFHTWYQNLLSRRRRVVSEANILATIVLRIVFRKLSHQLCPWASS